METPLSALLLARLREMLFVAVGAPASESDAKTRSTFLFV
jgi:hypothetical protein